MAHTDLTFEQRILVVHDTPLVAEDLRELLIDAGAMEVELARSLPPDPLADRFDTCFLSVSSEALADPKLFERGSRVAAHVVLITGFLRSRPDLPPRFSILSEPFRDEDVVAALLKTRMDGGSAV